MQCLIEAGFNSWSFPLARTAFETAEDLVYLAWAPDQDEYDYLGALAIVGAEMALSKTFGLARRAGAHRGLPKLSPIRAEGDAIRLAADRWEASRPGAANIVNKAYSAAKAAWKTGTKHWSTKPRKDMHVLLNERLAGSNSAFFASWYDLLASRSHPGLHSPPMTMTREDGKITLLPDGDEHDPIPVRSIELAVEFAITSLRCRFKLPEDGDDIGGTTGEST